MKKVKRIIGRKERVRFPELGMERVVAKVDTGAYRSSIHCSLIKVVLRGGERVLRVRFLDPNHADYKKEGVYFPEFKRVRVKSSNGSIQERFLVKTTLVLGKRKFKTEFTLTNRSSMKSPVLLGRKAINNRFLVDVSKTFELDKISE